MISYRTSPNTTQMFKIQIGQNHTQDIKILNIPLLLTNLVIYFTHGKKAITQNLDSQRNSLKTFDLISMLKK